MEKVEQDNAVDYNEKAFASVGANAPEEVNQAWMEAENLGSTVQSAIRTTEQALYDLDHPLSPDSIKSIEVSRQQVKERAFYQLFLDKLGALV